MLYMYIQAEHHSWIKAPLHNHKNPKILLYMYPSVYVNNMTNG